VEENGSRKLNKKAKVSGAVMDRDIRLQGNLKTKRE